MMRLTTPSTRPFSEIVEANARLRRSEAEQALHRRLAGNRRRQQRHRRDGRAEPVRRYAYTLPPDIPRLPRSPQRTGYLFGKEISRAYVRAIQEIAAGFLALGRAFANMTASVNAVVAPLRTMNERYRRRPRLTYAEWDRLYGREADRAG